MNGPIARFLFLIFISIVLFSCEHEIEERPVFTLVIDETWFDTQYSTNWVMLHDREGNLINYKAFERGDSVVFEKSRDIPGGKLVVTILTFVSKDIYATNRLQSYADVPVGSSWKLGFDYVLLGHDPRIGDFDVNVNGLSHNFDWTISDKHSEERIYGTHTTDGFSAHVNLNEGCDDFFLFIANGDDNPRYKFIRNVQDKSLLTYSYDDLDPFKDVVEVDFPEPWSVYYRVFGTEEEAIPRDRGYVVNSNILDPKESPYFGVKLGYPEEMKKFSTLLRVYYKDRDYTYSKVGEKPSSISFPLNSVYTVEDTTLTNYEFTYSRPFQFSTATWLYSTDNEWNTEWSIHAPAGIKVRLNDFPSEIAALQPTAGLEKKWTFVGAKFTTELLYEDFIESCFHDLIYTPDKETIAVNIYHHPKK